MSATLAICIAFLSIGSCIACYLLGQDNVRQQLRDSKKERRRRWEEFDDED
jgi:hypothetical protein